jgi:hypothetical protein
LGNYWHPDGYLLFILPGKIDRLDHIQYKSFFLRQDIPDFIFPHSSNFCNLAVRVSSIHHVWICMFNLFHCFSLGDFTGFTKEGEQRGLSGFNHAAGHFLSFWFAH